MDDFEYLCTYDGEDNRRAGQFYKFRDNVNDVDGGCPISH